MEEVEVKSNKKKQDKPSAEYKQSIKPESSYNDLLYQSSLEKMQNKMMNERAKSLISCVIPSYYWTVKTLSKFLLNLLSMEVSGCVSIIKQSCGSVVACL